MTNHLERGKAFAAARKLVREQAARAPKHFQIHEKSGTSQSWGARGRAAVNLPDFAAPTATPVCLQRGAPNRLLLPQLRFASPVALQACKQREMKVLSDPDKMALACPTCETAPWQWLDEIKRRQAQDKHAHHFAQAPGNN